MKAIKRFFYGREVFSAVQGVVVDGYELKVQKEVGCMAGCATVVICRDMIRGGRAIRWIGRVHSRPPLNTLCFLGVKQLPDGVVGGKGVDKVV